nr:YkgJ family cysteine cluster protein [Denitromonas sp.]
MPPLSQLHQDIDDHVQYIRQDQPDWLCTKGCDTCCRQLADLPQLSAAEWFLLRQGLAALPCEHQHSIRNKVAALPDQPPSP